MNVFDCDVGFDQSTLIKMVKQGAISILDLEPLDYTMETSVHSLACSRPLYMAQYIEFISVNLYQPFPPIIDIWKVFAVNVWLYIWLSFVSVIIADKIVNRLTRVDRQSLADYMFAYLKPMFLRGHDWRSFRNIIFIFWMIGVTPLVYILQNDLIAKMVNRWARYALNI